MLNKKCNCNEPYDPDYFQGGYPYCPIHNNKQPTDTQLPAEDKPSPLITDLLPAQEVHSLLMQEMKISSELNKEIKNVREYLFDNYGEFSEAKILSFQNGEKHTVDLIKRVITEYANKLHVAQQLLQKTADLIQNWPYVGTASTVIEKEIINAIKNFLDGSK